MTGLGNVVEAKLEADRARARLLESVRALETPLLELKEQLTPRHIMGEIFEGAKSKGADLAEEAVDAVRARPIAATGVVAAIALFLAREPLIDLAGKLVRGKPEKTAAKPARKRAKKPATRKPETTEKG